ELNTKSCSHFGSHIRALQATRSVCKESQRGFKKKKSPQNRFRSGEEMLRSFQKRALKCKKKQKTIHVLLLMIFRSSLDLVTSIMFAVLVWWSIPDRGSRSAAYLSEVVPTGSGGSEGRTSSSRCGAPSVFT
uniref:Uncharacterized protein n=1 Tax=Salarias fasciatus TaxID=181472 RepID=A0A672GJJ0_SALFA